MKFLNKLERRFGRFAIPNLTLYLTFAQGAALALLVVKPDAIENLTLTHEGVFAGEWWRLFTMAILPPGTNPLFAVFGLMLFYIMGTALENEWGEFRYNLYWLIGYLATLPAVLWPGANISNIYLTGSILMAFSVLNPEFTILLFFIFPVKVKWLGLLTGIFYIIGLAQGDGGTRLAILGGVSSFMLFFHREFFQLLNQRRRQFKHNIAINAANDPSAPLHTCTVCGVTEQSNRKMEFRYCPQCTGTPCYCIEHIFNHQHR